MDYIAAKNRSYDIARSVGKGDRVIALQDVRSIPEGTAITVTGTSNAGFRGIEFNGVTDAGVRVHGVNLGYFTPDWMF